MDYESAYYMEGEIEMRILQVSDIHFGNEDNKDNAITLKHNRENFYITFLDQIDEINKKKQIDYVFVTGDIVHSASVHEYDEAERALEKLSNVLHVGFDHFFLCPGNHDVDRVVLKQLAFPSSQKEAESYLNIENLEFLKQRFQNYIAFCEKLGVAQYTLNGKKNYLIGVNNDFGFNVMCINTSWFAKNDIVERDMWVGMNFIEGIKHDNLIKKGDGTFSITIMHHPMESWHKEERSSYIGGHNVFEEICYYSDIILTGHTHEVETAPMYTGGAWICRNGALYESQDYVHVFNVYDIDENRANITEFKKINRKWGFLERQIQLKQFNKEKVAPEQQQIPVIKNSERNTNKEHNVSEIMKALEDHITVNFLDSIVDDIKNQPDKIEKLEHIMLSFCKENLRSVTWEEIIEDITRISNANFRRGRKVGVYINGFEGTGKSTMLSLLYLRLRKLKMEGVVTRFPVYLDLHQYDDVPYEEAQCDLSKKLTFIDTITKKGVGLFLIFDGCDDYPRVNSRLEDILYSFIMKNEAKFILCIGSEYRIKEPASNTVSRLRDFIQDTQICLQCNAIEVTEDLNGLLLDLNWILSNHNDKRSMEKLGAMLKESFVKNIDFRTLTMLIKNYNEQYHKANVLTAVFYDYFVRIEARSTGRLSIARTCTRYALYGKKLNENALLNKKNMIIFRGSLFKQFLIAYYFVEATCMSPLRKTDQDLLVDIDFIFTPVLNNFAKELIAKHEHSAIANMVSNWMHMYSLEKTKMSMKCQICYFLGRVRIGNISKIKNFLETESNMLEKQLYGKSEDSTGDIHTDSKLQLVLYRTISVSMVMLNCMRSENYIEHLIYDERLSSINRGFHIAYYTKDTYRLGVSPYYYDNVNTSATDILDYLIQAIRQKSQGKNRNNYSLYVDIITVFSIFISRISDQELFQEYAAQLLDIAKLANRFDIFSPLVIDYIRTMEELIKSRSPYRHYFDEVYNLKQFKRDGWLSRNIEDCESIADHIYMTYRLGVVLLPDDYTEIRERFHELIDVEKYKEYDKREILDMILIHDIGEAYTGDHRNPSQDQQEQEHNRFSYYALLCTLPDFHGMYKEKEHWDEFHDRKSINARIASDLDKIEPVVQAYYYVKQGHTIDVEEWIASVREGSNHLTSLGDVLLRFVTEKVLEKSTAKVNSQKVKT